MRKKRKIPGITVGGPFPSLLPTPADFIRYTAEKEKLVRKRSGFWNAIIGEKDKGKSVRSYKPSYEPEVAKITDNEMAELNKPTKNYLEMIKQFQKLPTNGYFPEIDVYAQAGGGGGSGEYYTDLIPTTSNQPASSSGWWGQQPVPSGFEPSEGSVGITVQEKPISKKQEFTADDWRGKFCALCTITFKEGGEHTGILFVKKCGHWKLLEFNGSKIAGGTAGSFETELKKGRMKIEVHKTLYDADYVEPVIGADELEIL